MTPWNQLPLWALHVLLWTRTCRGERLRAEWVLLLKTQKLEITMETRRVFWQRMVSTQTSGLGPSTPLLCGAPPSWL